MMALRSTFWGSTKCRSGFRSGRSRKTIATDRIRATSTAEHDAINPNSSVGRWSDRSSAFRNQAQ